ncbi:hypothetical protein SCHPADRAFT_892604 [Schizopora paradoxa]|uniref:Uncharacterized protein n=1 Tax=Schizopora paradoxa TaxID=27342 RepID=A0A0H2REU3_9AGAM|nr:hypothetical protein SCHPADRAFT_892604 [Schizopora paradoxa]
MQLQIDGDIVTLGIALPPLHSPDGKKELLLNATVPSDYGFVTFSMGDHALHDGFMLTDPALANTTISFKSKLASGRLQIISKLQSFLFGHHDLLDNPFTVIRVTLSKTPPFYLDESMNDALLDLANSSSTTFVFDRSAATFSNFAGMAKQLGV